MKINRTEEEFQMKNLQNQLKSVSRSLVSLSRQVESVSKLAEKPQKAKAAPGAKKRTFGKPASRKKSPEKRTACEKKQRKSVITTVNEMIGRSRRGTTVGSIMEKTGLGSRQISNAIYQLAKRGKIETRVRGFYVKR